MDPIFALATQFRANELKSSSKKLLVQPPSYDRGAIESMWRHCSRNRMRTHRRRPLILSNLNSKATVGNDLCTENGVPVPKQSRIDVSESVDEKAAADIKSDSLLESGNINLTERKCPGTDDIYSSNSFSSNLDASAYASDDLLSGPVQCYDDSAEVKSEDTSRAMDGSLTVEECWWNKVDSHTWLQGLQSYLLLHSAVDSAHCPVPVAVLSPNPTPYTVIANQASHRQAVPSAIAESAVIETTNLWTEHQYTRPVLAPVAGYRMLTNGVLSPVPVYYIPVVNHSVCRLAPGASAVGSQHTYIGGQQSSMAAVDLVSFMHNYCLPPTSNTQSSVNSSVVKITRNAADQRFVGSQVVSSSEGPGSLLMTGGAASDEWSMSGAPQHVENSYLSNCQMTSISSASNTAGFMSSSSVCWTPGSLSSNRLAESWTDDASEVTVSCSVISDDVNSCNSFSADADLTIPGWFGKGLAIRRSKRRLSRQS